MRRYTRAIRQLRGRGEVRQTFDGRPGALAQLLEAGRGLDRAFYVILDRFEGKDRSSELADRLQRVLYRSERLIHPLRARLRDLAHLIHVAAELGDTGADFNDEGTEGVRHGCLDSTRTKLEHSQSLGVEH